MQLLRHFDGPSRQFIRIVNDRRRQLSHHLLAGVSQQPRGGAIENSDYAVGIEHDNGKLRAIQNSLDEKLSIANSGRKLLIPGLQISSGADTNHETYQCA